MPMRETQGCSRTATRCSKPTQGLGGSAAAWTPESLTGLVDEWDAGAAWCTTDGASDHSGGATVCLQGDGTNLQTANSFTFAGWFRMPASFGTNNVLWSKRTALGANEHEVNVFTGGTVAWRLSDGVQQNNWNTGTLTASTFHHLALVVDESAGTAQAYIDGATSGSAQDLDALSWDYTYTNTVALQIGAVTTNFGFQGRAQAVGQWDRALSGSEISALYNSGSGALYEDLTTGLKTSLVSWWNLHEASGARVDSHGSNDLTAVNTPGVAAGVASGTVQDRAPVKTWTGKVNSLVVSQSTIADQPIWTESGINSLPALDFDGTNHLIGSASGDAGSYPGSSSFGVYTGLRTKTAVNNVGIYFDPDYLGGTGSYSDFVNASKYMRIGSGSVSSSTTAWADDTNYVRADVVDGASSVIRLNGTELGSGTVAAAVVDGVTFGARGNNSFQWAGRIGTIIVQGASPTSDDVTSSESYLNDLYGAF